MFCSFLGQDISKSRPWSVFGNVDFFNAGLLQFIDQSGDLVIYLSRFCCRG